MEFIKTNKGGKKLVHDGYIYVIDKQKEEKIYWRCEKRGLCSGRLVSNGEGMSVSQEHCHPPDLMRKEVLKVKEELKEKASESEEITSSIVNKCTQNIPWEVAGALPKKESLSRTVKRVRNSRNGDEDLTVTTRGENFLQYSCEELSIYSTSRNLQLLKEKIRWFCDGTFDCAPIGRQLYTIHAMIQENKTLPLVYCITTHKNEKTYDTIFGWLESRNLRPASVSLDFELSAINSVKKFFPNAEICGCFFHFGQCLWRKVQGLGLQAWYSKSENAMLIKKLQAIAFVPPHDVYDCFDTLVSSFDDETDNILDGFLQYFETTWLGVFQRGRRRRPKFEVKLWSCYERTLNGLPRTNNMLEGWHNAFKRRMTIIHPTEEKLLRKLRSEQASTKMVLEQVFQGKDVGRKNKKYTDVNARLKNVVEGYDSDNVLDFLQAIARNL
ncbi:uncharacterized protein [Palaemon carinicauda]|uniref:uncharacterized protein n=1 Tax=Palaemon carinicauda TaxID=392227 RepID=UPI0035B66DDE